MLSRGLIFIYKKKEAQGGFIGENVASSIFGIRLILREVTLFVEANTQKSINKR